MDENIALEELQFIRKVIEDSKRSVIYNGMHYIVWGILVIAGMCLNYLVLLNHMYFNYFWIWAGVVVIGWIFSFIYGGKEAERQPRTFALKIVNSVWFATGVGMTVLGFIGPFSGAIQPVFISPVLSVLLGAAYLITGRIFESEWFSNLSIGWWAGAIVMFYFPGIHSLIIMAIMMLLFQTVPGIILFRKYKQEMAA